MVDVIKSTHPQITTTLHKKGDYFDLTGQSGRVWGVVSISWGALFLSTVKPTPSIGTPLNLHCIS